MKSSKLNWLNASLKDLKSVVVAYSGGLDSTFLVKAAIDALGKNNVLAVTARSETYPHSEYRDAVHIARKIDARHLAIYTKELDTKHFKENPVNRCYYCKRELFKKLIAIKNRLKMANVIDGTNLDDLKDVRYGRVAAEELGVSSPLMEAGINKADIRRFSKRMGLSTWDKPSFACLASRFAPGDKITKEKLGKIEKAEAHLKSLGFKQVRVRFHKEIARIECDEIGFKMALEEKIQKDVVKRFKALGFRFITLDLEGYRTGSMNLVAGTGYSRSEIRQRGIQSKTC